MYIELKDQNEENEKIQKSEKKKIDQLLKKRIGLNNKFKKIRKKNQKDKIFQSIFIR